MSEGVLSASQTPVVKEGEVQRELNRLDRDISSLIDSITRLREVLSPVLSSEFPKNEDSEEDISAFTEVGKSIRRKSYSLAECNDMITDMISRVEL